MHDVGEVLDRIPGRLLHQRQPHDRDRHLRDGVAVGLGVGGHDGGPERAGSARLVVDDDGLAEVLGGAFGDRAHGDIGGAAGRPRHDHRDRLCRGRPGRCAGAGASMAHAAAQAPRQRNVRRCTSSSSHDRSLPLPGWRRQLSPSSPGRSSPAPPSPRRRASGRRPVVRRIHVAPGEIELLEELDHLRVVVGLLEGVVQLLDDGGVHALGAGKAEREVELERIAELLQRRHVGPLLAALAAEHQQQRGTCPLRPSAPKPAIPPSP